MEGGVDVRRTVGGRASASVQTNFKGDLRSGKGANEQGRELSRGGHLHRMEDRAQSRKLGRVRIEYDSRERGGEALRRKGPHSDLRELRGRKGQLGEGI